MMLLGSLSNGASRIPCLIGIERDRVVVVAQDDLMRFSWPVADVDLDGHKTALVLGGGLETLVFTPEMADRFRWVMTAALQEASARRPRWWRWRKGPATRGLADKLAAGAESESAAA